mgnify:CR=1 FL=1
MKKVYFLLFGLALIVSACSKNEEQSTENSSKPEANVTLNNEVYSFDQATLSEGCSSDSEIICTINASIKCTINPQFSECDAYKAFMPKFVFMEDESLQRPTSQSYKITKIKPLSDGSVEVYTQSTCNGNWFGLCNGNIIYVMSHQDNHWIVKEIYAIEA